MHKVAILEEFDIYPQGKLQLGREVERFGLIAGPESVLCRIQIPRSCGEYPNDWFVLRNASLHGIKLKLYEEQSDGKILLPQWLLVDCFRQAWMNLKQKGFSND
jgi:hypothetical protein